MPRKRSHAERRAMFHNMGTGARVKVIKPFGINDVPVGSEGIVVEHFGKDRQQPVVAFHGLGRRVLKPDLIEVIKPSKKFEPIRHDVIKVLGSKEELLKPFKEDKIHYSVSSDGVVSGSKYYDNGEGDYFDMPFTAEVKNNEVIVHVNKSDMPHRWQWQYNDIKEDIVGQIESDLGVTR